MIAKTINFTDYNGNKKEKTYHFNLNKVELAEMEVSVNGGLSDMLKKISTEKDKPKIVEFFKDIILRSYGVKSEDGERFEKSPELAKAFSQTEAFVELFMEIANNSEAAVAFVKGVIPAGSVPANVEAEIVAQMK